MGRGNYSRKSTRNTKFQIPLLDPHVIFPSSPRGLPFNTPDSLVVDYLNHHGVVSDSSAVVYDKFNDGPFKGKLNGVRKYLVDFTRGARTNMGSYHIVDGARVHVSYPGQRRTCGRCHRTGVTCPAGGLAKKCEEMGGEAGSLVAAMRTHWEAIGYTPGKGGVKEDVEEDKVGVDKGGEKEEEKVEEEKVEKDSGAILYSAAKTSELVKKMLGEHGDGGKKQDEEEEEVAQEDSGGSGEKQLEKEEDTVDEGGEKQVDKEEETVEEDGEKVKEEGEEKVKEDGEKVAEEGGEKKEVPISTTVSVLSRWKRKK